MLLKKKNMLGNQNFPRLGRGLQKFLPMMGGQGGFPAPPGLSRLMNGFQSMPPAQGYPSSGYSSYQGNNQGYGGQIPVQQAQEQPKKGGIKGFISNLMDRRKNRL